MCYRRIALEQYIWCDNTTLNMVNIMPRRYNLFRCWAWNWRWWYLFSIGKREIGEIGQDPGQDPISVTTDEMSSNDSTLNITGYDIPFNVQTASFVNSHLVFNGLKSVTFNDLSTDKSDMSIQLSDVKVESLSHIEDSDIKVDSESTVHVDSCLADNFDENSTLSSSNATTFDKVSGGDNCRLISDAVQSKPCTNSDSLYIVFKTPARCLDKNANENAAEQPDNTAYIIAGVVVGGIILIAAIFLIVNVALKTKLAQKIFPHRITLNRPASARLMTIPETDSNSQKVTTSETGTDSEARN
jgi:hypothetical protein